VCKPDSGAGTTMRMSAFHTLFVVSVAVAAISIAILVLDDVFAELDRRRHANDVLAEIRRARKRYS
jgi:recombinational DNA repair ATPase RecF